jgi:hypothetical protein
MSERPAGLHDEILALHIAKAAQTQPKCFHTAIRLKGGLPLRSWPTRCMCVGCSASTASGARGAKAPAPYVTQPLTRVSTANWNAVQPSTILTHCGGGVY